MLPTAAEREAVIATLRGAGCVFAEDEAELIFGAAQTPAQLARMIDERVDGLPLEHVVGWTEFCGLRVAVNRGVFVPRQRSVLLAREAVVLAGGRAHPLVVDLCCGSGALGLVVARAVAGVELYAVDIDPTAVACARANLGAAGQVFEGDLYMPLPAGLRGHVDVVIANTPYVPTDEVQMLPREARLHEALVALDGGVDGLEVQRRVAAGAAAWLAAGGHLLVETSADQARVASAIFAANGLEPRVARDEEMDATIVIGTRRPGTSA